MDQLLLIEKQGLLQHVMAFRDDCAGEFSCKDTLNFWKWLTTWLLFISVKDCFFLVHTWNKTSSKVMASDMQDTPLEPSLIVVFCNKPVKVQMKKTNPLSISQICNFMSLLGRPFTQKRCHLTGAEFCQDPCTILVYGGFIVLFS